MAKVKFIIVTVCILVWKCSDSSVEPMQTISPIIGTWEYSNEVGYVDTVDPAHTFFPSFIFNSNSNVEEIAKYVLLPEKRYFGYKYVKEGEYVVNSDTLTLTIKKQIYVNFADSINSKPSPLSINNYTMKYLFMVNEDTLKLAMLGRHVIYYENYFKK